MRGIRLMPHLWKENHGIATGVDGKIYVNLGDQFGNPMAPLGPVYPAQGQLLIHDTHFRAKQRITCFLVERTASRSQPLA
jgi:hypothetical protein